MCKVRTGRATVGAASVQKLLKNSQIEIMLTVWLWLPAAESPSSSISLENNAFSLFWGGHHRKKRENKYEIHSISCFFRGETASFLLLCQQECSAHCSSVLGLAVPMGALHPERGVGSRLGGMRN